MEREIVREEHQLGSNPVIALTWEDGMRVPRQNILSAAKRHYESTTTNEGATFPLRGDRSDFEVPRIS